jgi:hypothetical protein
MRKLIIERITKIYNQSTNLNIPVSVFENTLLIFTDEQLLNIYDFMIIFKNNSDGHFLKLMKNVIK